MSGSNRSSVTINQCQCRNSRNDRKNIQRSKQLGCEIPAFDLILFFISLALGLYNHRNCDTPHSRTRTRTSTSCTYAPADIYTQTHTHTYTYTNEQWIKLFNLMPLASFPYHIHITFPAIAITIN